MLFHGKQQHKILLDFIVYFNIIGSIYSQYGSLKISNYSKCRHARFLNYLVRNNKIRKDTLKYHYKSKHLECV